MQNAWQKTMSYLHGQAVRLHIQGHDRGKQGHRGELPPAVLLETRECHCMVEHVVLLKILLKQVPELLLLFIP